MTKTWNKQQNWNCCDLIEFSSRASVFQDSLCSPCRQYFGSRWNRHHEVSFWQRKLVMKRPNNFTLLFFLQDFRLRLFQQLGNHTLLTKYGRNSLLVKLLCILELYSKHQQTHLIRTRASVIHKHTNLNLQPPSVKGNWPVAFQCKFVHCGWAFSKLTSTHFFGVSSNLFWKAIESERRPESEESPVAIFWCSRIPSSARKKTETPICFCPLSTEIPHRSTCSIA